MFNDRAANIRANQSKANTQSNKTSMGIVHKVILDVDDQFLVYRTSNRRCIPKLNNEIQFTQQILSNVEKVDILQPINFG